MLTMVEKKEVKEIKGCNERRRILEPFVLLELFTKNGSHTTAVLQDILRDY